MHNELCDRLGRLTLLDEHIDDRPYGAVEWVQLVDG